MNPTGAQYCEGIKWKRKLPRVWPGILQAGPAQIFTQHTTIGF